MSEHAIIPIHPESREVVGWTPQQRDIARQTIAKDLTAPELDFFEGVCVARMLNPFIGQIHCVKRDGKLTIQTGIDGFRLIAQRSGCYRGQSLTLWCGPDGIWYDVWLKKDPPAAAKVGVLHASYPEPIIAVALWTEYVPKNEKERFMWNKMPAHMLAKCAEALAIRKAFPEETGGIYTDEEMAQAIPPENVRPVPNSHNLPPKTVLGDALADLKRRATEWGLGEHVAKIEGRGFIPQSWADKLEALILLRMTQDEAKGKAIYWPEHGVADPKEPQQAMPLPTDIRVIEQWTRELRERIDRQGSVSEPDPWGDAPKAP